MWATSRLRVTRSTTDRRREKEKLRDLYTSSHKLGKYFAIRRDVHDNLFQPRQERGVFGL